MGNTVYTLWKLLEKHTVQIPLIQRDYAQGRTDEKIQLIRNKLVRALHEALTTQQPLRLDFVYGSLPDGFFVPLDGQQRLTTLFLLHWYLAARSQQLGAVRERLGKFSYQTRSSSRAFCRELVSWEPVFTQASGYVPISEQLQDAHWFQPAWLFDPTVHGMLTMLDELEKQFGDTTGLFERLQADDCPVDFYFLNMEEAGLTDDLYLKMNARGKPLTSFENWRAEFDLFLQRRHGSELQRKFGEQMDTSWLDLLWPYRDQETALTDKPGENLFGYLTRMLAYSLDIEEKDKLLRPTNKRFALPFSFFERVYQGAEQVDFLFRALYFLARLGEKPGGADGWLAELLTERPEAGLVVLFSNTKPELVRQVMHEADPSLRAQVLLLAVVAYGAARGNDELVLSDLRDLLRIVRNLLERERQQNDTDINSNLRYERLQVLVPAVQGLAEAVAAQGNTYAVLAREGAQLLGNLVSSVVGHEQMKAQLLLERPDQKEALHQLEDMTVLRGDLHNLQLADAQTDFAEVAKTVAELWLGGIAQEAIIGAWLTQGDYSVYGGSTGWGDKYFFGGCNWYTILAADSREVAATLPGFLTAYQRAAGNTPAERLTAIRQQWLARVPKNEDWLYYFVAYPEMTANSRAYYAWGHESNFELHLLRGNNLKAEHVDPYVRTVLRRGKLRGLVASEPESWLNDKYLTPLRVLAPALPTDVAGPRLYCKGEGWLVVLDSGCRLPLELEMRYGLQLDSQGQRWLRATAIQDRIERVEDFVLELQHCGLKYEPVLVEVEQGTVD